MKTLDYIEKTFKAIPGANGSIELRDINRTIMAKTLKELGFKEGAEIGVAEGYHAEVLCTENPELRLHCVDVWKKYPGYEEYDNIKEVYYKAIDTLGHFNTPFYKEFSMKALRHFEDSSLDFVYIDSAHDFLNVAMDISEWSKKVKPGGIVFGHDYKHHRRYVDRGKIRHLIDVKVVVDAFCLAKGLQLFVLANDKKDPTFGNDNPGWMFIRQEGDRV